MKPLLKAGIDNPENTLKSNISSTCPHNMVNFGLRSTNGRDWSASLGHPSKFQAVSRLVFVYAPTSLNERQPNFARCLAVSWADTPVHYIHFRGLLSPSGILPGTKFTWREPNFAAFSTGGHLYSAGWPSRLASARPTF